MYDQPDILNAQPGWIHNIILLELWINAVKRNANCVHCHMTNNNNLFSPVSYETNYASCLLNLLKFKPWLPVRRLRCAQKKNQYQNSINKNGQFSANDHFPYAIKIVFECLVLMRLSVSRIKMHINGIFSLGIIVIIFFIWLFSIEWDVRYMHNGIKNLYAAFKWQT